MSVRGCHKHLQVTKRDGTSSFHVDYRRLNSDTRKDAHSLIIIADSLNGQEWFANLYLVSGYWQVKLSDAAKDTTLPHIQAYFFNSLSATVTHQYTTCYTFTQPVAPIYVRETIFNNCRYSLDIFICTGLPNSKLVIWRVNNITWWSFLEW